MKDYLVTVTVKNNYLFTMMRRDGIDSPAELSRRSGVSPQAIGYIANLSRPAVNKDGSWAQGILRLAEYFNTSPDCLVPPQHVEECLETNTITVEMSSYGFEVALGYENQKLEQEKNPIDFLEHLETIEVAAGKMLSLKNLTEQELKVIKKRFGLENEEQQTLGEVASEFGVSRERIRQIELKALRKMRHPRSGINSQDIY